MNGLLPEDMKAFSIPSFRGRVYVRAPSTMHGLEVIRSRAWSVSAAYVHRRLYQLSRQESEEIEHFLDSRQYLKQELQAGSWVKVVRGSFKGDIARVLEADVGTDVVVLQIVPRFALRNVKEKPSSRSFRAHAALFDVQDAEELSTDRESERREGPRPDTFCLRDGRIVFENGLQYLRVMGQHYVQHYEPEASEVTLFTSAGIPTILETNRAFLNVGDRVSVKFGADVVREGSVRSKKESSAVIEIEDNSSNDGTGSRQEFALQEIERVLQTGCYVEVRLGPRMGVSGMVICSNDRFLTIFDSERMKEVGQFAHHESLTWLI